MDKPGSGLALLKKKANDLQNETLINPLGVSLDKKKDEEISLTKDVKGNSSVVKEYTPKIGASKMTTLYLKKDSVRMLDEISDHFGVNRLDVLKSMIS